MTYKEKALQDEKSSSYLEGLVSSELLLKEGIDSSLPSFSKGKILKELGLTEPVEPARVQRVMRWMPYTMPVINGHKYIILPQFKGEGKGMITEVIRLIAQKIGMTDLYLGVTATSVEELPISEREKEVLQKAVILLGETSWKDLQSIPGDDPLTVFLRNKAFRLVATGQNTRMTKEVISGFLTKVPRAILELYVLVARLLDMAYYHSVDVRMQMIFNFEKSSTWRMSQKKLRDIGVFYIQWSSIFKYMDEAEYKELALPEALVNRLTDLSGKCLSGDVLQTRQLRNAQEDLVKTLGEGAYTVLYSRQGAIAEAIKRAQKTKTVVTLPDVRKATSQGKQFLWDRAYLKMLISLKMTKSEMEILSTKWYVLLENKAAARDSLIRLLDKTRVNQIFDYLNLI